MSYAKFGEESDVYVIKSTNEGREVLVCFCTPQFTCVSEQGMLDHLNKHVKDGDNVPGEAIRRLLAEKKDRAKPK
jgi:hypothetical protein